VARHDYSADGYVVWLKAKAGLVNCSHSESTFVAAGARANLEGLLQAVAEFLEKKGLPRRLNKKSSLKITRELNKR
jgi:hypothetical protein